MTWSTRLEASPSGDLRFRTHTETCRSGHVSTPTVRGLVGPLGSPYHRFRRRDGYDAVHVDGGESERIVRVSCPLCGAEIDNKLGVPHFCAPPDRTTPRGSPFDPPFESGNDPVATAPAPARRGVSTLVAAVALTALVAGVMGFTLGRSTAEDAEAAAVPPSEVGTGTVATAVLTETTVVPQTSVTPEATVVPVPVPVPAAAETVPAAPPPSPFEVPVEGVCSQGAVDGFVSAAVVDSFVTQGHAPIDWRCAARWSLVVYLLPDQVTVQVDVVNLDTAERFVLPAGMSSLRACVTDRVGDPGVASFLAPDLPDVGPCA